MLEDCVWAMIAANTANLSSIDRGQILILKSWTWEAY